MAEALTNHGTIWTDQEIKALLAIWGDSKIQEELDGAVRNQVVLAHCKAAQGTRNTARLEAVPCQGEESKNKI